MSRSCEVRQRITLAVSAPEEDEEANDDDEEEEVKDDKNQKLEYHGQIMLNENAIEDLELTLIIGKNEIPVKFNKVLVENPSPEVLTMAQVKLVNKLIFDTIQEVQEKDRARSNDQIY